MTTRERLQAVLKNREIVEAYLAGKQIQISDGRIWLDIVDPCFDGSASYRVKPEPPKPREFWINLYPQGSGPLCLSKRQADDSASIGRIECIHVREVVE